MLLSTKAIENAKKEDEEYFLKDGEGLRVAIKPTGSKTFQHRIRVKRNGKWSEVVRTLGRFPQHSLKEARYWKDKNNEYKAKGLLPPKKYDLINQVSDEVITFKEVFEIWFDKMPSIGKWKPSYTLDVKQRADMYLLPPLGNKSIDAIDTKMLIDLLLEIDEQGKHDTREKIQSILTRVLKHAVILKYIKSNPAREISSDLFSKKAKSNYAFVSSSKDIKLLLSMLEQAVGTPQVIIALNLAPHVFLRPSELAGLSWSEIDWDDKLIRIPAERMKIDKPHIVPMSNHVVEVLTKLKDSNLDSTLCFPSPLKNSRPISTNSMLQAMRKVGVEKEVSTIHGFRHMASTTLNEKGYSKDAIELQIAHEIPGVRGVYNHAQYLEERKPMMEDWSSYLDNLQEDKTDSKETLTIDENIEKLKAEIDKQLTRG
jgi:integrase